MTWIDLVDRLCVLSGIEPFYFDILGNRHETTLESKVLILNALGSNISSVKAATKSLSALEDASWRERHAPFVVQRLAPDGFDLDLFLPAEEDHRAWDWKITSESNEGAQGGFRPQELISLGSREIDGHRIEHRRLRIHAPVSIGYHQLQIVGADISVAKLALAPERCYLPDVFAAQNRRLWGLSGQLYTMRSEHNWGIGDFGDLARLCQMAGGSGASALAINPLHALFPDKPDAASPYSPSSRLFLNPIYIDVEAAPLASMALGGLPGVSLDQLRASAMVDYPKVWAVKRLAFEALYQVAKNDLQDGSLAQDFRHFVERGGQTLEQFAVFSALEEVYGGGGSIPWQQWPATYRIPQGDTLQRFKRERGDRIAFHQYVQYLADNQLRNAALKAQSSGMEIGIVRDLALGANPDGCDAWMSQESFANDLRCGAPPDDFNPHGQEWGVLPLDPLRLRRDYGPFIAMLQANMRHAGGLRIDHIIGLQRQFLVPLGGQGGYVRFPMEELVKILALESHRNSCLVIGEDLGTVPEGFRGHMQEANILGCSLVYFERSDGGAFAAPHDYRKKAAASITTHDLPTFRGYWEDRDIDVRQDLCLSTAPEADAARNQRHRDRLMLIEALVTTGVLDRSASEATPSPILRDAVHAFLASSSAQLFLAQIEDLTEEKDQVNVPGTTGAYPNWQRKLAIALNDPSFYGAVEELSRICSAQSRGTRSSGGS